MAKGKYNIKLALYYSLWDENCTFYLDDKRYLNYRLKQLTELLDGCYGEVAKLWLDGGWKKTTKQWGLDQIYDLEMLPYAFL